MVDILRVVVTLREVKLWSKLKTKEDQLRSLFEPSDRVGYRGFLGYLRTKMIEYPLINHEKLREVHKRVPHYLRALQELVDDFHHKYVVALSVTATEERLTDDQEYLLLPNAGRLKSVLTHSDLAEEADHSFSSDQRHWFDKSRGERSNKCSLWEDRHEFSMGEFDEDFPETPTTDIEGKYGMLAIYFLECLHMNYGTMWIRISGRYIVSHEMLINREEITHLSFLIDTKYFTLSVVYRKRETGEWLEYEVEHHELKRTVRQLIRNCLPHLPAPRLEDVAAMSLMTHCCWAKPMANGMVFAALPIPEIQKQRVQIAHSLCKRFSAFKGLFEGMI